MSCQIEYIALSTGVLVLISEILPFLNTKCNGICHGIHCLMTSDCCKNDYIPDDKDIEIIEQKEEAIMVSVSDSDTESY